MQESWTGQIDAVSNKSKAFVLNATGGAHVTSNDSSYTWPSKHPLGFLNTDVFYKNGISALTVFVRFGLFVLSVLWSNTLV